MTRFDGFDLAPLLQAAADDVQAPVSGEVRWVRAGEIELAGLTCSDRELIHVVTGEWIPERLTAEIPVSFFALQIAVDRLTGPLRDGEDVSIAYVEDAYTHYEENVHGSSVSGDLLDLSLAFLAGRELALLGPDLS